MPLKFLKGHGRKYFGENQGAPFIIAFMATLMLSAVFLMMRNYDYANAVATCGYFLVVIGVILQLISFIRSKKAGTEEKT